MNLGWTRNGRKTHAFPEMEQREVSFFEREKFATKVTAFNLKWRTKDFAEFKDQNVTNLELN